MARCKISQQFRRSNGEACLLVFVLFEVRGRASRLSFLCIQIVTVTCRQRFCVPSAMAKEPFPVLLVVALAPDRSWALPWVPVNSATEVANAGARFAVVRQKSNLTHSNNSLGLSIRHEYQRPLWADIVCNLAPPPSGSGSRLRNSSAQLSSTSGGARAYSAKGLPR